MLSDLTLVPILMSIFITIIRIIEVIRPLFIIGVEVIKFLVVGIHLWPNSDILQVLLFLKQGMLKEIYVMLRTVVESLVGVVGGILMRAVVSVLLSGVVGMLLDGKVLPVLVGGNVPPVLHDSEFVLVILILRARAFIVMIKLFLINNLIISIFNMVYPAREDSGDVNVQIPLGPDHVLR